MVEFSLAKEIDPARTARVEHSHALRAWVADVNDLRLLGNRLADRARLSIKIVFPDTSYATIDSVEHRKLGRNSGVFSGRDAAGELTLSYVNEAIAGAYTSFTDETVWEIRNAGNGSQFVSLLDGASLRRCATCEK